MVLNNIGVTGPSGLVGSHLIAKLLKNNFKVIAISRKRIKSKKNIDNWRFFYSWMGCSIFGYFSKKIREKSKPRYRSVRSY